MRREYAEVPDYIQSSDLEYTESAYHEIVNRIKRMEGHGLAADNALLVTPFEDDVAPVAPKALDDKATLNWNTCAMCGRNDTDLFLVEQTTLCVFCKVRFIEGGDESHDP